MKNITSTWKRDHTSVEMMFEISSIIENTKMELLKTNTTVPISAAVGIS